MYLNLVVDLDIDHDLDLHFDISLDLYIHFKNGLIKDLDLNLAVDFNIGHELYCKLDYDLNFNSSLSWLLSVVFVCIRLFINSSDIHTFGPVSLYFRPLVPTNGVS